jgi:hypothetical protein
VPNRVFGAVMLADYKKFHLASLVIVDGRYFGNAAELVNLVMEVKF